MVGVGNGAYVAAEAIMLIHEAVHAIGNLPDPTTANGGSKALSQILIQDCLTPLQRVQLGGLNP
jgi:hypothetical protein